MAPLAKKNISPPCGEKSPFNLYIISVNAETSELSLQRSEKSSENGLSPGSKSDEKFTYVSKLLRIGVYEKTFSKPEVATVVYEVNTDIPTFHKEGSDKNIFTVITKDDLNFHLKYKREPYELAIISPRVEELGTKFFDSNIPMVKKFQYRTESCTGGQPKEKLIVKKKEECQAKR